MLSAGNAQSASLIIGAQGIAKRVPQFQADIDSLNARLDAAQARLSSVAALRTLHGSCTALFAWTLFAHNLLHNGHGAAATRTVRFARNSQLLIMPVVACRCSLRRRKPSSNRWR